MPRRAFTLIELLVVVTIIVVLLALLTPALDKAIYQAELASCGANLHGVGGGVLTYAAGNKRVYPSPPGGRAWQSSDDRLGYGSDPAHDLRPVLKGYVDLKLLLCPLTKKIALGPESNGPDTQVHATYDLWFGWRYFVNGTHEGMSRMGQAFSYTNPNTGDTDRFRLLSSDFNFVDTIGPSAQSSHPDYDGVMWNEVYQDQPVGLTSLIGGIRQVDTYLTLSRWSRVWVQRGPIDMNVVWDDMAVQRYDRVEPTDKRMVPVPANNYVNVESIYIPPVSGTR